MEPPHPLGKGQQEPNMSMLQWNSGAMWVSRGSFHALVGTLLLPWLRGDELTCKGIDADTHLLNNSYKSARILSEEYNLYYAVWCTNEHELYDLSVCLPSLRA